MSDGNIIKPFSTRIDKWDLTAAEKQMQDRGWGQTQHGCVETGITISAVMLRRENAGECLREIAKRLHAIHELMADHRWDDEKVCVTIGIQARNGWVEIEGEWVEQESKEYLDAVARKAAKPFL